MSYTLDYDEPIPKVVERLRLEHKNFAEHLSSIYKMSKEAGLKDIMNELDKMKQNVLRHEVEEEARLMRVIMWELSSRAEKSISIMRQHRNIAYFLKYTAPRLLELPESVARREVRIFVNDMRKHHAEEEKIVFPLALRADKLAEKHQKTV
ncbi:MAG: hemerythrin domain-containing protein [Conexivisphaerales archaeon]